MASTILSDNGVTSGSAGLKTTAASDGALALQTTTAGGTATTALTIDTSQNVLVNTTTGYGKFTVQNNAGTGKVLLDNYVSVPTTENVMSIYADATNGYIQSYNNGYKNIAICSGGGKVLIGASSSDLSGTSQAMVIGSGGLAVQFGGTTGTYLKVNPGDANGVVNLTADARSGNYPAMTFTTSATERMRIDSSGNVGIGVTPSAWGSGSTALQIGNGAIWKSGSRSVDWITNGYNNGTNYIYNVTAAATYYRQYDGTHSWYNAASGTAGSTITFTNTANLDTNSLYTYVGVNPSNNGAVNARIFNSSSGSGTITLYVGNQTITTSSDVRLKENVVNTQRNALELLGQLRVVDHTWNDPSDQCENNRNSRGTWMGLIAQEAQPIIPWLVNKPTADVDENGDPQYWHMDYGYSVPLLVKAIQELKAINDTQAETINALTARIVALEQA